ncbi:hypothetical protein TSAR_008466, partial [Trichomalopsis sarcophagae]
MMIAVKLISQTIYLIIMPYTLVKSCATLAAWPTNLVAIGLGIVDLMPSFVVGTGYALCDLQLAQVLISNRRYHTYDCVMLTVI